MFVESEEKQRVSFAQQHCLTIIVGTHMASSSLRLLTRFDVLQSLGRFVKVTERLSSVQVCDKLELGWSCRSPEL